MLIVRLETELSRTGIYRATGFSGDTHGHTRPSRLCREESGTPLSAQVFLDVGYFYGFKDWEQMEEWFPIETRQMLAEYQPHITEGRLIIAWYEVDEADVLMGNLQLAFRRRNAKRVRVEAIDVAQSDQRPSPRWVEAVHDYACAI